MFLQLPLSAIPRTRQAGLFLTFRTLTLALTITLTLVATLPVTVSLRSKADS